MGMKTLWHQMGKTPLKQYVGPDQFVLGIGQSGEVNQSRTGAEKLIVTYTSRAGVKKLDGLVTTTGTAVSISGSGPNVISTATLATGIGPAMPTGPVPTSFLTALSIDLWRAKLGLPLHRIICQTTAISGQPYSEMDDDPMTGVLGTVMIDNGRYAASEALRLSPGCLPLFVSVIHGEANETEPPEVYLAGAGAAIMDHLDEMEAVFGFRPPAMIFQSAGFPNMVGKVFGCKLAQVQLGEQLGLFAGPCYPAILDSTSHMTFLGSALVAENAGYIFSRREQGARVDMTPLSPQTVGNQVTIPFRTEAGKGLAFDAGKYDGYGGLIDHGIEVSGATVSSVSISGNALVITAGAALSGRTLSIAFQSQDMSGFADGSGAMFSGHRSDIMEANPEDSLIIEGAKLKRFVPSCRWQL